MYFGSFSRVHDECQLLQAIVCSFVYGGSKAKNNLEADTKADQNSEVQPTENSSAQASAATSQYLAPNSGMAMWPPSSRPGVRDPNTEIDLTRG